MSDKEFGQKFLKWLNCKLSSDILILNRSEKTILSGQSSVIVHFQWKIWTDWRNGTLNPKNSVFHKLTPPLKRISFTRSSLGRVEIYTRASFMKYFGTFKVEICKLVRRKMKLRLHNLFIFILATFVFELSNGTE